MAFFIDENCISCAACEPECPNAAIGEGESIFIINPVRCTDCVGAFPASRCADVCPVDACHPDPKHLESKEELLKKWRGLHPGDEPAPGSY